MGYHILAEAAMVLHFAFIAYIVGGGFLAWRRPRAVLPHLAAAAYGLGITVVGWSCPLTRIEDWARVQAGRQGLPDGFIAHYLTGVVYPADNAAHAQAAAAATVALSWAGAAWLAHRRANRSDLEERRRIRNPGQV
ncbi:DUF2784 domain-containing protein [Actinorugispora endophytica]|uniref:Uncharacterized protein DUF2784 n=1 Tax=Actinorugispora endophytica TaxID=1605990 RepID=A0A4R6URY3_9ACTN|nr:DUF2784 domain-containing protein [Actinorugispora endophytica]TDQ48529.1 uncharacterized protein DUF2784 [Actinorugispora endophytica]